MKPKLVDKWVYLFLFRLLVSFFIIIIVSKQGLEIEVHMQIYFFILLIPVCWLPFLKLVGPYWWLPLSSCQKKKQSVPSVGERTVVLGPLFWLRKTAPGLSVFETDGLSLCFFVPQLFLCVCAWGCQQKAVCVGGCVPCHLGNSVFSAFHQRKQ